MSNVIVRSLSVRAVLKVCKAANSPVHCRRCIPATTHLSGSGGVRCLDGELVAPVARVTHQDNDVVVTGGNVGGNGNVDRPLSEVEALGERAVDQGRVASAEVNNTLGVGDLSRLAGGVPGNVVSLTRGPNGAVCGVGHRWVPNVSTVEGKRNGGDKGEESHNGEEESHDGAGDGRHYVRLVSEIRMVREDREVGEGKYDVDEDRSMDSMGDGQLLIYGLEYWHRRGPERPTRETGSDVRSKETGVSSSPCKSTDRGIHAPLPPGHTYPSPTKAPSRRGSNCLTLHMEQSTGASMGLP